MLLCVVACLVVVVCFQLFVVGCLLSLLFVCLSVVVAVVCFVVQQNMAKQQ